ncbi:MAG: carbon-nitrogen hydrolase family protein [Anaerolineae bacterium]
MDELRRIRVGVVQMACVLGDKKANLEKADRFLSELEDRAEITCFPELFTTGYHLELLGDRFPELADPVPGPTTDALGQMARSHGQSIVGGVLERGADGNVYDAAVHIDASGMLAGVYRKSHLYPAERGHFAPGDRLGVWELNGVTIGTAICFEHAFPHIFTVLALQGAKVIFIPSAVPTGFEYLLDLRTRARAQDNQIFTVAVNRVGVEGEVTYCGRSKIVNPRGQVLEEAPADEEATLAAELDLGLIAKERAQEPTLINQRPELYRKLLQAPEVSGDE